MIAFSNGEAEKQPEDEGGGGALFARPDNIRSDARLAADMISLGVISAEQAGKLLRKGFALAAKSATAGRAREYAACMKIAIECAKLAQNERHKNLDKHLPDLYSGVIEHRLSATELLSQTEYAEWLRQRERDSDARLVCTNGHQGNGKPLDDGHTRNGH